MNVPTIQRRLGATVTGYGERVIVFGNGLGTSQATWRHVAAALHSRARLVRFDNVCSPAAPSGGYRAEAYTSLHDYVDDVVGLLDELEVTDALFVGHSISGIIGLMAAIAAPERIAQVVTICSSPCFLEDVGYHAGMPREDVESLLADAQSDFANWAQRFATVAIGPDASEAERSEFATLLSAMRPDIAIRTLKTVFLGDNRPILPRVTQPVTVLHTVCDTAFPMAAGEYLVQRLPSATLVPLPSRGHLPHLTAPRDVIRALEHVLDRWP
ncbi:MAG: alpha/beta hydrolase [Gemmatimonadaceae bacterium]|nr:alpha/beta hydrolase [Gemmatimonadaceae bacterium]